MSCFASLEGRLCPVCSRRPLRVHRQIATVENIGPGKALFHEVCAGNVAIFPAIAALMVYQWTRLSFPMPDLIVPLSCPRSSRIRLGFDPHEHLAKLLSASFDIPMSACLKSQWDKEVFFQTGLFQSRFVYKKSKCQITDRSILLISLSLEDLKIQQAAQELQLVFPRGIYALSLVGG